MKNKWYRSKGVKGIWIALMHILAAVAVCCAAVAVLLLDSGINFTDWKKPYVMSERFENQVLNAVLDITAGINGDGNNMALSRYAEGNTNITYIFVDNKAKKVYTNKSGYSDLSDYNKYKEYEDIIQEIKNEESPYFVNYFLSSENKASIDFGNMYMRDSQIWAHTLEQTISSDDFVFAIQVDGEFPVKDALSDDKEYYDKYAGWLLPAIACCGTAALILLIGFIWLTIVAGRKQGDEEVHLCAFDHWFTEISAALIGGVWLVGFLIMADRGMGGVLEGMLAAVFLGLYTMVFFLTGYLSLVRRIKAKTLWKDSFLRWFLMKSRTLFGKSKDVLEKSKTALAKDGTIVEKSEHILKKSGNLFVRIKHLCKVLLVKIRNLVELYSRSTDSRIKMILQAVGFLAIQFIVTILTVEYWYWFPEIGLIAFAVFDGGIFIYILKKSSERGRIMEGLKRITDGELQYKIPVEKLSGEQKIMAEYINNIGAGLDAAVEKSVKNERMKTELITNVSHDIKTPLTSIINYVDLLKRENFTDEKVRGYLEVLEEKAQRLKVLTEDVVEASKASTGNITFEKVNLNFVEMVNQVIGEFEEKLEKRHLTVMVHLIEEPALIYADGRRMWRVLENIFNNVVKYALEGTRVYVQVEKEETKVVFSLKNISAQPLNISADELTERFIRGDVARNTEGSGLGLSIAKSLTELQGGVFQLYLDGDLFKVTIEFTEV